MQGQMVGQLRNSLGYCETIRAKAGKSSMSAKADDYEFSMLFPSVGKNLYSVEVQAKSSSDDSAYYTSVQTKTNSVTSSIGTADGRQKLELDVAFRDEIPLPHHTGTRHALDSSHAVAASAGPSTKTSLKYSLTSDLRDSMSMPTAGSYINSSFELAVPPGTAQFAKFDLTAQTHKLLSPIRLDGQAGLVGSLCYTLGFLQPLNFDPYKESFLSRTSKDKSHLCDRYHLGGPLALRGFDLYGAGPRANLSTGGNMLQKGDSLGSNRKAQVLALLSAPLPAMKLLPTTRALLFANVGSSGEGKSLLFPFGYPRASVGCGLAASMGVARIEVTYSIPILKAKDDVVKGFQIGVGISMS